MWGAIALITISEDCLVAVEIGLFIEFFLNLFNIFFRSLGRTPLILRLYSIFFFFDNLSKFFFHSEKSPFDLFPERSHSSLIFLGITNGLKFQLSFLRVKLTSSIPRGEPCEDDLPCLFGEP